MFPSRQAPILSDPLSSTSRLKTQVWEIMLPLHFFVLSHSILTLVSSSQCATDWSCVEDPSYATSPHVSNGDSDDFTMCIYQWEKADGTQTLTNYEGANKCALLSPTSTSSSQWIYSHSVDGDGTTWYHCLSKYQVISNLNACDGTTDYCSPNYFCGVSNNFDASQISNHPLLMVIAKLHGVADCPPGYEREEEEEGSYCIKMSHGHREGPSSGIEQNVNFMMSNTQLGVVMRKAATAGENELDWVDENNFVECGFRAANEKNKSDKQWKLKQIQGEHTPVEFDTAVISAIDEDHLRVFVVVRDNGDVIQDMVNSDDVQVRAKFILSRDQYVKRVALDGMLNISWMKRVSDLIKSDNPNPLGGYAKYLIDKVQNPDKAWLFMMVHDDSVEEKFPQFPPQVERIRFEISGTYGGERRLAMCQKIILGN
jgi:hypothetical protein